MDRPIGVTILAVLTFIAGLVGLCYATVLLITSGFADFGVSEELFGVNARSVFFVSALLSMIGTILYLLFSYGALGLRKWAWWLGILATGLQIASGVFQVLNGGEFAPTIARGLLDIVIFVTLLLPHIRHAFFADANANKTTASSGA